MATESIGTVPAEEECAQTGITPDYGRLQRLECGVYIAALTAFYGQPPEGCRFYTKGSEHDAGTYYEVNARAPETEDGLTWLYKVCDGLARWTDAGIPCPPVTYMRSARDPSVHYDTVEECVAAALKFQPTFPDENTERMRGILAELYPQAAPALAA